ncbi:hypothetical protein RN607_04480 [Demequina capsici]|uniref:CBM2 domain-containing protein n=1 Tax=Demequina capsici TaxID=3075620 RepID=A0AA96FGT6_9MICO|nr:hypothetical protein [Demequina sp. PMTSA13]WNM28265.1 hypothetical protein RN607_04480 [Demequina sp. PMTSA13]
MTDDSPTDPIDEQAPTTLPLPTTGPALGSAQDGDPTVVLPAEAIAAALAGDAAGSAPPSVQPVGAHGASDAAPAATDPRRRPPLVTLAIAGAIIIVVGVLLGAAALLGRGAAPVAASTTSPSNAASPWSTASPLAVASPAETPSPTMTSSAVVGTDGTPGADGACAAEIRKDRAKDGRFELEVRVKARAGGVTTWTVRIGIGDATATDVTGGSLTDQADGVVTVASEEGAKPIASGKTVTFTVTGTGEPSGLDIACTS